MTRVALAGAGMIAGVHALTARSAGLDVVAVASRSASRAATFAKRCGARACTFDELPGGADLVIVATPPAQHAGHALGAIERGAAVLIEKPLARTLDEADALVAAADAGAVVAYGENLVHAPATTLAIRHVRELGPLTHLEVRAVQERPTWGDFLTEAWGGGALFDLGVHPLAVALLFAGADAVVGVRATLAGADDHPTDEHALVDLDFASGMTGRVISSWRGDTTVWDAQAASAIGVVRLELMPEVALERDGDPVALPRTRTPEAPLLDALGYLGQLDSARAAVETGRSPSCGAAFGRAVLDIVCAAYRSARTGEREPVPFTGPRDRAPLELWRGEL